MALLPFKLLSPHPPSPSPRLSYPNQGLPYSRPPTLRILCAKRTGKQRYPSEKKKVKLKHKEIIGEVKKEDKFQGVWRLSNLGVPLHKDPGKDFLGVSEALLQEIAKVLEFPVASMLPSEAFSVVRKSFDARKTLKEPKFVYAVEMDANKLLNLEPHTWDFISRLEPKVGLVEHMPDRKLSQDLISIIYDCKMDTEVSVLGETANYAVNGRPRTYSAAKKPKIAVVGSGPSGLFASLVLAELGADVTLMERGQPVEQRGRDIGALVVRRLFQAESNFCFGEVPGVMVNW